MELKFTELFNQQKNKILQLGLSYFSNSEDAADLLQETFVKYFSYLQKCGTPADPAAFIYRMAQNLARNSYRFKKRFCVIEDLQIIDSNPDSAIHCEKIEKIEILIKALSTLSPVLRETARLSYLSGFSSPEIINALKIPAGTLKRRLFTARELIKKEVLRMTNHGLDTKSNIIPEIRVEYLTAVAPVTVKTAGYGQCFASVLKTGDRETINFYDYPGGILTLTTRTTVLRQLEIAGKIMWEVLVENQEGSEPAAAELNYFSEDETGYHWEMKIESNNTIPNLINRPDESITSRIYSSAAADPGIMIRPVNLTIDGEKYCDCISVLSCFQDGTPMENFYLPDGRELLHRRYASRDARLSKFFKFEYLPVDESFVHDGKEYRRWYDSLLVHFEEAR